MSNNNLTNSGRDMSGLIQLCNAIKQNTGLRALELDSNQLCGVDIMGRGTYTSEGILAISEMLRVNRGLQSLSLRFNQLDAEAAKHLSNALVSNQSLITLDVRNNNLDSAGKKLLQDAATGKGVKLQL